MSKSISIDRLARTLAFFSLVGAIALPVDAMDAIAQPSEPFELVQTIALPGVRGRIDHFAVDAEGGRLFVAALGNDTVEVIDLRAGRPIERLEPLQEPQGVAYASESKRLFVATGKGGRLDVYEGSPLKMTAHVSGLDDADNLRYDPASARLYLGYGSALAAFDSGSLKRLGSVSLAGHPESFQLESAGPRIFVNVPSAHEVDVIDRGNLTVIAKWSLDQLSANYPMALDEAGHRLFVATRRPAALVVLDTETGKRVAQLPIGGDADDLFFDAERKLVIAICGEGVVDIVKQIDADHYAAAGRQRTEPGARTGLFVAKQGLLYVALRASLSSPAEIRVYRVKSQ